MGEAEASVECYFEDTWVGGTEGMYMESPYVLSAEFHPPGFALPRFLLTEIFSIENDVEGDTHL